MRNIYKIIASLIVFNLNIKHSISSVQHSRYLLLSFFISFLSNTYAQSPDYVWLKSEGGSSVDEAYSISTDAAGNSFIAGSFSSPTITFGTFTLTRSGSRDVFLVKYDVSGIVQWATSAGGINNDDAYSVFTDASGNVYLAGTFGSSTITFGTTVLTNANANSYVDLFLVKYNSGGNVIWAKSAGGGFDDVVNCITSDASGNIYITGYFDSNTILFGSTTLTNVSMSDVFLVKYDPDGNVLWANSVSGTGSEIANSITVDASGNCHIAGNFGDSTITFGSIILTNNSLNADMFLAKYDASGNVLWAKSIGGMNSDQAKSVSLDDTGNIYLAGYFKSSSITIGSITLTNGGGSASSDIFLSKSDANGNVIWAKNAGGTNHDAAFHIATDNAGNSCVTGYFKSSSITFGPTVLNKVGSYDLFVVKYDTDGNVLWANGAGGGGDEYGYAVSTDASGYVYLTGSFDSDTIHFNANYLTKTGSTDIFLVKLNSTTGIESTGEIADVFISPNPSNGIFYLQMGNTISNADLYRIVVCSIIGDKIYETLPSQLENKDQSVINLSSQPNGVYFVFLQTRQGTTIKKLIVTR